MLSISKGKEAKKWWQSYLKSNADTRNYDASRTALLLAHEMEVRRIAVYTLHQVMKTHNTANPQAALFLYDRDHTP